MSGSDFDTILDECLARMSAGESIETCLARHPAHADALRPLLGLAAYLAALPRLEPRPEAIQAGQARMLAAFRERRHMRNVSISPFSRYAGRIRGFFLPKQGMQMRHVLRFAVAVFLALFIGTNLAVVASAGSLPGDPLYGVKRTWEEARLALTFHEPDREQLLEQFAERRQEEVREMVQEGRQGTLDLEGILQALGDGNWSVDGLALVLSEQTIIEGQLEPGATVWVRAQIRNDGTLVALRIRIRTRLLPPTLTGPRQTPDDMPNGRPTQTMTPMPQRSPEPTRSIQVTDTPEPTATPRQSETREATEPPEVDRAPGPTETREPEQIPGPTRTGEGDHTPQSTETRGPDHTPEPTKTREADHTPGSTDEPQHTPEPTAGPQHTPEPTGRPQRTPEPTEQPEHTPEPTGEPQHTSEPTRGPRTTPEPTRGPQHTPEPTDEPEHTPELTGEPQHAPQVTGGPQNTPESTGGPQRTPASDGSPEATSLS